MSETRKKIQDLISHLDEQDIRVFFHNQNIKGHVGETTSCPVFNYLKREVPETLCVYPSFVRYTPERGEDEEETYVSTTNKIRNFIHVFDSGMFPGLIAEKEE